MFYSFPIDNRYVSNVSIIYEAFMLLYYLFWMFTGFIIHFYIIFGTNLLTQGQCQFLFFPCFRVSQKRKIKWSPIDLKLHGTYFWKESNPETSSARKGSNEEATGHGTLVPTLTYFFRLYILIYPENNREHHETLFPPPQPSLPVRSHLGAFSCAPPEEESITEGFYINTIASPMMCE